MLETENRARAAIDFMDRYLSDTKFFDGGIGRAFTALPTITQNEYLRKAQNRINSSQDISSYFARLAPAAVLAATQILAAALEIKKRQTDRRFLNKANKSVATFLEDISEDWYSACCLASACSLLVITDNKERIIYECGRCGNRCGITKAVA